MLPHSRPFRQSSIQGPLNALVIHQVYVYIYIPVYTSENCLESKKGQNSYKPTKLPRQHHTEVYVSGVDRARCSFCAESAHVIEMCCFALGQDCDKVLVVGAGVMKPKRKYTRKSDKWKTKKVKFLKSDDEDEKMQGEPLLCPVSCSSLANGGCSSPTCRSSRGVLAHKKPGAMLRQGVIGELTAQMQRERMERRTQKRLLERGCGAHDGHERPRATSLSCSLTLKTASERRRSLSQSRTQSKVRCWSSDKLDLIESKIYSSCALIEQVHAFTCKRK